MQHTTCTRPRWTFDARGLHLESRRTLCPLDLSNRLQKNKVIKLTIAPSMMAKNALVSKEECWEELFGNILKKIWSDTCLDASVCKNAKHVFLAPVYPLTLAAAEASILGECCRILFQKVSSADMQRNGTPVALHIFRLHLRRTHAKTQGMERSRPFLLTMRCGTQPVRGQGEHSMSWLGLDYVQTQSTSTECVALAHLSPGSVFRVRTDANKVPTA